MLFFCYISFTICLSICGEESNDTDTDIELPFILLLSPGEIPLTARGSWILGNIDERFYYRVNYDEDNWNKLFAQLKFDHKVAHYSAGISVVKCIS